MYKVKHAKKKFIYIAYIFYVLNLYLLHNVEKEKEITGPS